MAPNLSPTLLDGCLDHRALVAFNSGEMSHNELEVVADHVSRCSHCLAALAQVHANPPADGLEAKIRVYLASGTTPTDALATFDLRSPNPVRAPRAFSVTVDASSPAPLAAKRIDRYVLLEEVGRGGMGVVYRAEDPEIGQVVALKTISDRDPARTDRILRFRIEGHALARLQHPNVVRFFHFGEHGGYPYYTMEFVGGGNLEQRLVQGPLPFREAAELVRTLAEAIHAVHLQEVIHRDLKPGNILFTRDGTPKVADFGLAKLLAPTEGDFTGSDVILGTVAYMAPEQAEGRAAEVGYRTDVYALGAILYAAMIGRPPYAGAEKWAVLRQVALGQLAPLSSVRVDIPSRLEEICVKCLARSPSDRYSSAQQLAEDLTDWLNGQQPRWLPGRAARAFRITRRRALVAGVGLALASTGGVLRWYDPNRALRAIQSELAQRGSVVLIGGTGSPKWSRWCVGASKGQQVLAPDGTCSIQSWGTAMLELLPEIQAEAYRLTAKIRHEASDKPGEVGLYVARQGCTGAKTEIHFFNQVTFNDVRLEADLPIILGNGRPVPHSGNVVQALPRLLSEPDVPPDVNRRMRSRSGRKFTPNGEGADRWRVLELTVSKSGVTATWDGHKFRLSADHIEEAVATDLVALRRAYPDRAGVQELRPTFSSQGGAGLYLQRGKASFQSVTVTLLEQDPNLVPL